MHCTAHATGLNHGINTRSECLDSTGGWSIIAHHKSTQVYSLPCSRGFPNIASPAHVSPGHLRVSLHISLHYSLLMSPSILYLSVPFSPSCFTSCTEFPLFPMYLNFPSSLKFLNLPRLSSVCHPPVAVFSRRHRAAVICWVAVSLQCLWVFGLKPPSGRLLLADLRSRSPSASLHSLPRLWQRVAPPAGEQWDYRSATPHMDSHTFPHVSERL